MKSSRSEVVDAENGEGPQTVGGLHLLDLRPITFEMVGAVQEIANILDEVQNEVKQMKSFVKQAGI